MSFFNPEKKLKKNSSESQREQQKQVESLRVEVIASRKREKQFEKNVTELQQFIEHFRQQQGNFDPFLTKYKLALWCQKLTKTEKIGLSVPSLRFFSV